MKEYVMKVKAYTYEDEWQPADEWEGSELYEAEDEIKALTDAVGSLTWELTEGLIGNPFGTEVTASIVLKEFKMGWVQYKFNDINVLDVITMEERGE